MAKSTNKRRVTITELEERLDSLDKRLSAHLQSVATATANGHTREATSVSSLLSRALNGSGNGSAQRPITVVSVEDLARAMLVGGAVPTEQAILHTIRRYLVPFRALRRVGRLGIEPQQAAQHVSRYFSHWLTTCQADLKTLRVSIIPVERGVPFNPKVHTAVSRQPAETKDEVDRIAVVKTPVFFWRDVQGDDQVYPAEVVVYSEPVGAL